MPGFNDARKQAIQFWGSRTTRQKSFLVAGAAATILVLTLFVGLINKPDYKPLSTGLEASDAQALGTLLDGQGIPHQISADGKTVSVPADKLDVARMQAASAGAPHSGRTGFELFDKMSWGQTEFDEKVTYQRALEGELERTIETLSEVKSARVHLVMPTDSVFTDRQRGGKASVILKLRGNGLSKGSVLAISRLVSGAVDELQPGDVSIIDADSDRSLGLGHDGSVDGSTLEDSLAQRLISTLEPVVGVDKVRASVNVQHDMGSSEENQEKYDPSGSVVLTHQQSEDQAGGTNASGGVPGTTSNVPSLKNSKPANVSSPDATQSSKTESAQYGVNKSTVHRMVPAGRIERVSAAILVDDEVVKTVKGNKTTFTTRKRTQEELNKIQELAEEVIGFDAKRGDTITVQNMSFASNAGEADLAAPAIGERVQKAATEYGSLLRPFSLLALFLLAYWIVLRPIQKQAMGAGKPLMPPESALAAGAKTERFALGSVIGSSETDDPSLRARRLKEEAVDLIAKKPVNTTRALQAWLREETS